MIRVTAEFFKAFETKVIAGAANLVGHDDLLGIPALQPETAPLAVKGILFISACSSCSKRLKQTILASLVPPKVSTKARLRYKCKHKALHLYLHYWLLSFPQP
jgi:hypothetical protein